MTFKPWNAIAFVLAAASARPGARRSRPSGWPPIPTGASSSRATRRNATSSRRRRPRSPSATASRPRCSAATSGCSSPSVRARTSRTRSASPAAIRSSEGSTVSLAVGSDSFSLGPGPGRRRASGPGPTRRTTAASVAALRRGVRRQADRDLLARHHDRGHLLALGLHRRRRGRGRALPLNRLGDSGGMAYPGGAAIYDAALSHAYVRAEHDRRRADHARCPRPAAPAGRGALPNIVGMSREALRAALVAAGTPRGAGGDAGRADLAVALPPRRPRLRGDDQPRPALPRAARRALRASSGRRWSPGRSRPTARASTCSGSPAGTRSRPSTSRRSDRGTLCVSRQVGCTLTCSLLPHRHPAAGAQPDRGRDRRARSWWRATTSATGAASRTRSGWSRTSC